MQDDAHQQLSAYVDGALDQDEQRFLERRLANDPALRQALARYYTISAAAGGRYMPGAQGLADRVREALETEGVDQASPAAMPTAKWRRASFLLQPVAGVAIAASVALGLVVAWPMVSGPTSTEPAVSTVQIAAEPSAGSLSRVGGQPQSPSGESATLDAHLERQLRPYLIDHNEKTAGRTAGDPAEAAGTAGHDADR
jgi:sigma-E factor negative regulatory protein RseA